MEGNKQLNRENVVYVKKKREKQKENDRERIKGVERERAKV